MILTLVEQIMCHVCLSKHLYLQAVQHVKNIEISVQHVNPSLHFLGFLEISSALCITNPPTSITGLTANRAMSIHFGERKTLTHPSCNSCIYPPSLQNTPDNWSDSPAACWKANGIKQGKFPGVRSTIETCLLKRTWGGLTDIDTVYSV